MIKVVKKSDKSFELTREVNGVEFADGHSTNYWARSSGNTVTLYNSMGVLVISGSFDEFEADGVISSNAIDCVDEINKIVNFKSGGGTPSPTPTVHNELTGRTVTGCHPIKAIEGLEEALQGLVSHNFTIQPADWNTGTKTCVIPNLTINNINEVHFGVSNLSGIDNLKAVGDAIIAVTEITNTSVTLTCETIPIVPIDICLVYYDAIQLLTPKDTKFFYEFADADTSVYVTTIIPIRPTENFSTVTAICRNNSTSEKSIVFSSTLNDYSPIGIFKIPGKSIVDINVELIIVDEADRSKDFYSWLISEISKLQ